VLVDFRVLLAIWYAEKARNARQAVARTRKPLLLRLRVIQFGSGASEGAVASRYVGRPSESRLSMLAVATSG
jgi:hypothetical protein